MNYPENQDEKKTYLLLDLAGNREDQKQMTPSEAKEANRKLWEGERFLRWAEKSSKSTLFCNRGMG